MPILNPKDLKNRVEKYWQQGKLHKAWLTHEALFPLSFNIPTPSANELLHQFSDIQTAIKCLKQDSIKHAYQLNYKTIQHQKLGTQTLPEAIIFNEEQYLLHYLNKTAEFNLFKQLCALTLKRYDALNNWLIRYPFKLMDYADVWLQLLAVCDYFIQQPLPNVYLRQLDIPTIDSKFIEKHQAILTELLDIVLPDNARYAEITGLSHHGFARRYGLRYDLPTCRFRLLDSSLYLQGLSDLTVTVSEFKQLDLNIKTVFIVENKITGLAFPDFPNAMVIFGLGYSVELLQDIPLLQRADLYYWGDLDTHGFAILSRLRSYYPQLKSFLMTENLLHEFQQLIIAEPKVYSAIPEYLTAEELAVFLYLQHHALRLEQEFIAFNLLRSFLNQLKPS